MPNADALRTEPKRHHYVPRVLLRGFATERKAGKFQTQVFDKQVGRSFATAIENIAVESNFNAIGKDGARFSLEAGMAMIESAAAGPLSAIVAKGTLVGMSVEDRVAIDLFCALQFLRGTGFRAQFLAMSEGLREQIIKGAGAVPKDLKVPPTQDDAKIAAFRMMSESLVMFTQQFHDKEFLLFTAPEGQEFLIGDNPVALDNQKTFGPYGNLGLAVRGIQIYVPITSRYSLGYWCSSVRQEMIDGIAQGEASLARAKTLALLGRPDLARRQASLVPQLEEVLNRLRIVPESFLAGTAIPMTEENLTRMNSLQIRTAERWIMSRSGDFSLVTRMIADDPVFRSGQRPTIG